MVIEQEASRCYRLLAALCHIGHQGSTSPVKRIMYRTFVKEAQPEGIPRKLYRRFAVEKTQVQGHPVFTLRSKRRPSARCILFLHGGGGMMRPTTLHYGMICRLIHQTDAEVVLPFYPLAPKHNAKQALQWLEQVYSDLLKHRAAQSIVIIGDSAGANLSAALCARVSQKPAGLVLISPAAGLDRRDRMQTMESIDPLLSVSLTDTIAVNWSRDIPLTSADVNASSVDYTGFPAMQIYYGTAELFYPSMAELLTRIEGCGASVATCQGNQLCHDWAIVGFMPEGRAAIRRMARFVVTYAKEE